MENKYRHEIKYLIESRQAAELMMRSRSIMTLDSHVIKTGKYQIKSLYFDDIYDTNFYENENGVNPRKKFRIRIYNDDASNIQLELKRKCNNKTLKQKCSISKEQYGMIVSKGKLEDVEMQHPLLQALYTEMQTRLLKPKVIIAYERVPFICQAGNVRVTFDSNIISSNEITGFLGETRKKRLILPSGQVILEVKYDEFLPDFIQKSLQLNNLRQCTFSKYYWGRKFTTGGKENGFFRYF